MARLAAFKKYFFKVNDDKRDAKRSRIVGQGQDESFYLFMEYKK